MSAGPSSLFSRARPLALPALGAVLLALSMVRVPVSMDIDPATAHRGLLYETLRLGRTWTDACLTAEGPLTALQTPVYLSGSMWMTFTWQIAGNLLLAAIFVAAAWRLPWRKRAWALAFLAAIFARWPEPAPWLAILLLGHDLIRRWDREPRAVVPAAAAMGFLALFSGGHLALALVALVLVLCTARPPLAKLLAAGGLALGLVGGWLALAQPLSALFVWLHRALTLAWSTSAAWRFTDLAPVLPWVVVCAAGFVIVLARDYRTTPGAQRSLAATIFLAVAGWFAWKTVALQPYGTPLIYFTTLLLGGFLLWHHGCRGRWVAALLVLGLTGLVRHHPGFLPNALGHFNRQMLYNARQLQSAAFRPEVRAQVSALRQAHFWPKIIKLTGGASVGVDDDALPRALFNNLPLVYPADTRTGPAAPAFVVQSLAPTPTLAPAFRGAAAQLALYRNYEVQAEENGFLLWRRKTAASPAPALVAEGSLPFGEPLKLPAAPGTAYWVELDVPRGLAGRLWSLLDEVDDPGLIVRDDRGNAVRYALPPAAARGFLADPLIHGNAEFVRWQRGDRPARTAELTIVAPPASAWLWSRNWRYRLYAVPDLRLAGEALRDTPAPGFRAFNRSPVGTVHSLPFSESPADQEALLFVHPSSLLEFAVTGADRRVRGSFGVAAGAYETAGRTDGVDFAIEFLGLDGSRQVLLHRYLNPGAESGDRGVQEFDLALPAATSGRLLFRTFNPPSRSAAWDWAFWRQVVIE